MRKDLEDKLDRSQPALIVTYGNTTRKIRPLDRDVMMLGQSSGCDVHLKSPEVYPVHALVVRTAEGWRVKDCTGRGATRLNGRTIQDEPLTDGDVIQIGTFSFQLHLPPGSNRKSNPGANRRPVVSEDALPEDRAPVPGPGFGPDTPPPGKSPPPRGPFLPVPDSADVKRLQRSRKNLARLGIALRRRYHTTSSSLQQLRKTVKQREAEMQLQQQDLDALRDELEMRSQQVTLAEHEMIRQRQLLEEETAVWRGKQLTLERQLTLRRTELETGYQASFDKMQQRGREVEAVLAQQQWSPEQTDERVRQLYLRATELEHYNRYLLRCRGLQAPAGPAQLDTSAQAELQRLQEENQLLDQQRQELEREAQELLEEQRVELERLNQELEKLRRNEAAAEDISYDALNTENEKLRQMLAELQEQVASHSTLAQMEIGSLQTVTNGLQQENEALQARVRDHDRELQRWQDECRQARTLQEQLRLQLREQDLHEEDKTGYEAELTRFRVELERDRATVNDQLAELHMRSHQVEQASRELEQQLAHERELLSHERQVMTKEREELAKLQNDLAQDRDQVNRQREELLHERGELGRQREEVQQDQERGQRDLSLRDRLAHVQKLKEDLAERRQALRQHAITPSAQQPNDIPQNEVVNVVSE